MSRILLASLFAAVLSAQDPASRTPGGLETIGGWVVADSDIALHRTGEAAARQASFGAIRWPGGRIPFEIDPAFKLRDCLDQALAEWNTRTPVRLVPRAATDANYLVFTPGPRSFTTVGLNGGAQPVFLESGGVCEYGLYRTIVHEIGHSVGLFHEHQRSDRDRYIRLQPEFSTQLPQDLVTILGSPTGPYDFASVMHYGPLGGGPGAVIETIPRGIPTALDQGTGPMLSPGDLDAIQRLYGETPRLTTISTNPPGLDVLIDGERRSTPFAVNWSAGSQHTIDVPSPQTREGARYEFGRWNDEGGKSHVVTAGALTHLAANFISYVRVRGVSNDAALGSVAVDSPDGTSAPADGLRLLGTPVRVRAQAAPGFFLRAWESGRGSRNPLLFPVFHSDPLVNDFVAQFAPYPVTTLTSQPLGLAVTANGITQPTPAQFRWEPGTVQAIDYVREAVFPGARYRLEVIRTAAPLQSQGRIIATAFDASIVAQYRTEYPVRLSASPAAGGEVVVTPGSADGYVLPDDRLQIRAVPAAGFRFAGFRGAGGQTANPLALTVNGPVELVGEFVPAEAPAVSLRNAASALAGPVSPGEIVSLFTPGLPDLAFGLFSEGVLATEVSGVRVTVNGAPAPIVAVAPGQVNAIVPYQLAAGATARFSVLRDGNVVAETTSPVVETAPALFTANSSGSGPAAALNEDGSLNNATKPAKPGQVIVLFGTGGGALDAGATNGAIATAPLAKFRSAVTVEIGGRDARVLYAGPAPGSVHGLLQVNAEIPVGVSPGAAAVFLRAGAARSAPGVTIAIE